MTTSTLNSAMMLKMENVAKMNRQLFLPLYLQLYLRNIFEIILNKVAL